MKKQVFHLKEPGKDPYLLKVTKSDFEPSEPIIIWSLRFNGNVLFMPELHF